MFLMQEIKKNLNFEMNYSLFHKNIKDNRLAPIIKWAGGKEKELQHILPNMPKYFNNYFEPFVGGGAVYFSIDAKIKHINDKSKELIDFYKCVGLMDGDFFNAIERIATGWLSISDIISSNINFFTSLYKKYSTNSMNKSKLEESICFFISDNSKYFKKLIPGFLKKDSQKFLTEVKRNLLNKIKRMNMIEKKKHKLSEIDILKNIEAALKSAYYMYLRYVYNKIYNKRCRRGLRSSLFYFIRSYAYAAMFRYNRNGEFNVPYGGIAYNQKDLFKKIDYLKSNELRNHIKNSIIGNHDFEVFLKKHRPKKDDFIFFDPPYHSVFSTYAQNTFSETDHKRLAKYCLHGCKSRWMLVIKNTKLIYDLYDYEGINIKSFDKTYQVSFMDRNDKRTIHLLITNY